MKKFLVLHFDKFFEVKYYREFQDLSEAVKYFLSLRSKVEKKTKGVQLVTEALKYGPNTNVKVSHIVIAQFYTKNNVIETFETEYKSEFDNYSKEK